MWGSTSKMLKKPAIVKTVSREASLVKRISRGPSFVKREAYLVRYEVLRLRTTRDERRTNEEDGLFEHLE